jgi:hypothetical protein
VPGYPPALELRKHLGLDRGRHNGNIQESAEGGPSRNGVIPSTTSLMKTRHA